MIETRDARPEAGTVPDRDDVSDRVTGRVETSAPRAPALKAGDRRLLALVEAATGRAQAAAGAHLVCRSGCTPFADRPV